MSLVGSVWVKPSKSGDKFARVVEEAQMGVLVVACDEHGKQLCDPPTSSGVRLTSGRRLWGWTPVKTGKEAADA